MVCGTRSIRLFMQFDEIKQPYAVSATTPIVGVGEKTFPTDQPRPETRYTLPAAGLCAQEVPLASAFDPGGLGQHDRPTAVISDHTVHLVPFERLKLPVTYIRSPEYENPDGNAMRDLTASIHSHGVLHPALGYADGDNVVLLTGVRRYRAAHSAGLTTFPVLLCNLTDQHAPFVQLIENTQRRDVHALDEGHAFYQLHLYHGFAISDIANLIHRDRRYVRKRFDIYSDDVIRKAVRKEWITFDTANELMLLARYFTPSRRYVVEGDTVYRSLFHEATALWKRVESQTGEPPTSQDVRGIRNSYRATNASHDPVEFGQELRRDPNRLMAYLAVVEPSIHQAIYDTDTDWTEDPYLQQFVEELFPDGLPRQPTFDGPPLTYKTIDEYRIHQSSIDFRNATAVDDDTLTKDHDTPVDSGALHRARFKRQYRHFQTLDLAQLLATLEEIGYDHMRLWDLRMVCAQILQERRDGQGKTSDND